jgi:hypothetical protein
MICHGGRRDTGKSDKRLQMSEKNTAEKRRVKNIIAKTKRPYPETPTNDIRGNQMFRFVTKGTD